VASNDDNNNTASVDKRALKKGILVEQDKDSQIMNKNATAPVITVPEDVAVEATTGYDTQKKYTQ
jgi:hypothetical protein